jgi:hypothetical protein
MRANPAILAGFLAVVLAVLAGISLAKGGFFIGKHEGDTLHLLDMMMRMSRGAWPHLDFMTPIGVLSFAPFAFFVSQGAGVGQAILLGQALVAALFLPAIWWVAATRFRGSLAYVFGAGVLVLILALVHGEAERSVSISMHYNRWAWAAAYLAIAAALIRPRGRPRPVADGLVIGGMLAVMALVKMTYFVAFVLPIVVALLGRRAFGALLWACIAGIAVAVLITLLAGVEFWFAYAEDLLAVARSDLRPRPGLAFSQVLGSPSHLGATLVLLVSVVLLLQADRLLEGMVLLLLAPAFVYVTYQNFGNDPQWLGLLGLLLIALAPRHERRNGLGWELKGAIRMAAVAALALATPSIANLAYSPFRHWVVDPAKHTPLIPVGEVFADLYVVKTRARRLEARVPFTGERFAALTSEIEPDDIAVFQGEELPRCSVEMGLVGWLGLMAADLKASGLTRGRTVIAADLLSNFWLYGAMEPLPGGAPWNYGGLPGFGNAELLLVPLCALAPKERKGILEEVAQTGTKWREIRRTEMYILYEKQ